MERKIYPGRVSIVIPAHNEGQNLVDTVHFIIANAIHPDFEVIVVDDGSTDGSGDRIIERFGSGDRVFVAPASGLGVAGARNYGAQMATGDLLIFLDGHCYTPPGWMESLIEPLADPEAGLVGPCFAFSCNGLNALGLGAAWQDAGLEMQWLPRLGDRPYPVPLLPGGCQAVRRAVFELLGGYDRGMTRWGSEDHELCLRAWLMGYQVLGQPQSSIYHVFRQQFPYRVEDAEVQYNRLRMALLHFNHERIDQVFNHYRGVPDFTKVMLWLLESDCMERRSQLLSLRKRDDDWFFSRFNCGL
jgi:glycosyltransferase involved in cell wall biosynthesis